MKEITAMRSYLSTIIILYLFLLLGCDNTNKRQLELALQTAGNNRQQLEKVIQHYKGDKQKEDVGKILSGGG